MIFISGVISIVFQKNMLCTNKICVIYFCLNCVKFCLKCFIYLVSWRGGEGVASAPHPFLLLPQLVHLCSSRQGITYNGNMEKKSHSSRFWCIYIYSGIIKLIQELVSYIQIYSEPCVTVHFMK